MFGKSERDKNIEKLRAGIELHEKALADLKAAHSKAEAELQNYRASKVFAIKHEQEADLQRRTGMNDATGAPVLPMAGMIFMPEPDYQEETLNRNRRYLLGEIGRIREKLEAARQALAILQQ